MLKTCIGTTYLDHAGTTPYPKSLVEAFSEDMLANLFGNPHSRSPSSELSTHMIDAVRFDTLRFFKADPDHFDLIFVANATAAIKLAMDCMLDYSQGKGHESFQYAYHRDAHTSLVGPRKVAVASACFGSDRETEQWMLGGRTFVDAEHADLPLLFAYPAQSNMNGRRLPLHWPGMLRRTSQSGPREMYSLLDAAAFVTTAQLDLSDVAEAPDFTALSFYKVFGFPDLGALVVRKEAGHVLRERKYFGGGTVDMVVNGAGTAPSWHVRKQASIHEAVEDGTPPFHSVLALRCALRVHRKLFGSMTQISAHTARLARGLHVGMVALKHTNGTQVCEIYQDESAVYGDSRTQGPTIAFNLRRRDGSWVSKTEFENAAIRKNIQLRTGGVCNPGGIAWALQLSPEEMVGNFAEGVRCGNEIDVIHGKPTGIIRVSLGAMSSEEDVERFLSFLTEFARLMEKQASDVTRQTNYLESTHNDARRRWLPFRSGIAQDGRT